MINPKNNFFLQISCLRLQCIIEICQVLLCLNFFRSLSCIIFEIKGRQLLSGQWLPCLPISSLSSSPSPRPGQASFPRPGQGISSLGPNQLVGSWEAVMLPQESFQRMFPCTGLPSLSSSSAPAPSSHPPGSSLQPIAVRCLSLLLCQMNFVP